MVDPARTVCICGLPDAATEGDVKALAANCGEVVRVTICPDPRDPCRVATVVFATEEACETAILLSGADIGGSPCEILPVAIVPPKEQPLTSRQLVEKLSTVDLGSTTAGLTADPSVERERKPRKKKSDKQATAGFGGQLLDKVIKKVETKSPVVRTGLCGCLLLAGAVAVSLRDDKEGKAEKQVLHGRDLIRRELRALTLESEPRRQL
eukprot:Hpha_TRINITY_DN16411_c2_g6::TRINITY_DN16411_c2_g6_i1::g.161666::m.161666